MPDCSRYFEMYLDWKIYTVVVSSNSNSNIVVIYAVGGGRGIVPILGWSIAWSATDDKAWACENGSTMALFPIIIPDS